MAHRWLDALNEVIEIGGAAHNDFGLVRKVGRYRNVDYTDQREQFKALEIKMCGEAAPVHIIADMGSLPLEDCSVDGVISSHSIEHTWDVFGALMESMRVLKPVEPGQRGGILYLVVPHPDVCVDDRKREETLIVELAARRDWARWHDRPDDGGPSRYLAAGVPPQDYLDGNRSPHRSVWRPQRFRYVLGAIADACANPVREHYTMAPAKLEILAFKERDDKVGNGYVFVCQKQVM